MSKVFTAIFAIGFIGLGAWIKYTVPDADKYDPFRNPLASVEIIKAGASLINDDDAEIAGLDTGTYKVVNPNINQNDLKIPINDEFKNELIDFYTSKYFNKQYSSFIGKLVDNKEIIVEPTIRSYIYKLVANDIDENTISISAFLVLEDKDNKPVIIESKFIADKEKGSPLKNMIKYPNQDDYVVLDMPAQWDGFTIYDVALFGMINYSI